MADLTSSTDSTGPTQLTEILMCTHDTAVSLKLLSLTSISTLHSCELGQA